MATITKRGKKWSARIRLKSVSVSQSFSTKTQAQVWITQTEAAILSGEYGGGTDKTLGDAISRYVIEVAPTKKSRRQEGYIFNAILSHDIARIKLSRLTTEHLAQWRDENAARVKSSSNRRYLLLISAVLETAKTEWKWIDQNPVKNVKKPSTINPRDRIFSDEEVALFVDSMAYCTDIQQTVVDCFLFALETGMRAGEIIGLEWPDIDGRVATLHDTKNGDKRRVPLSLEALRILETRRTFSKPFHIKAGTLSNLFAIHIKRAGIESATFHDSRHTACTRLAKKLQPFDLARMLGHRNMTQTLAYYNASAESMAEKLD